MERLRTREAFGVCTTGRRPRTPGVAYAVLTILVAVLVGTVALTSRQSAPPTIAEFAPQAVEQITDASDAAGASRGRAEGMSALDENMGPADAPAQTTDVARVRQCVGDPPRQIEDPQSPPCVPYWSGDNGGATYHGVTRDEVRVVYDQRVEGGVPARVWEAFFNRRFELYGRRLRLLNRPVSGGPAGERAAARAAYEEDRAFASFPHLGNPNDYYDEIARLGMVSVHYLPSFPESYMAPRRPHMWMYPMANDRLFSTAGNWYCTRFAARNAVHAGDPLMQLNRRKPGIVLTDTDWQGGSVEPVQAQLDRCGERTDAVVHIKVSFNNDAAGSQLLMQNAMLQMKSAGVTSVICLCWIWSAVHAASNQGYFPEWLVTSYLAGDWTFLMWVFQARETKGLMAISTLPMTRRISEQPSVWASDEEGHALAEADRSQEEINPIYRSLLLIASGVQMAGPNLTPATFEQGLQRTKFPNPAHRIMAGAVGFNDDHSMTNDVAEMWWSETGVPPYQDSWTKTGGLGAYCYVDHGARRTIGTFPTDDPFFDGTCNSGG